MNAIAAELTAIAAEVIPFTRRRPRDVQHCAAEIVAALGDRHTNGLDPVLVPTDRILERWAVSQGSDEFLMGWDEVPTRCRPPPLPDDLSIIVDQLILRSTVQAREFVTRWYMRPNESVIALAKALGLHRDTVYMRWRSTLWYMRGRMLDVNLDV